METIDFGEDEVLGALEEIYDLLKDEENWTTNAFAKTAANEWVEFDHPNAVQWSIVGAVHKVCGRQNDTLSQRVFNVICRARWGAPNFRSELTGWNDRASHLAVELLLQDAVQTARDSRYTARVHDLWEAYKKFSDLTLDLTWADDHVVIMRNHRGYGIVSVDTGGFYIANIPEEEPGHYVNPTAAIAGVINSGGSTNEGR